MKRCARLSKLINPIIDDLDDRPQAQSQRLGRVRRMVRRQRGLGVVASRGWLDSLPQHMLEIRLAAL
jgi:hypothetical protein